MWWCRLARSLLRPRGGSLSFPGLSAAGARWPPRAEGGRSLGSRPALDELFAMPALQRLLDQQQQEGRGGASPELAARVRLLRGKEQELRDTERLAREGEEAAPAPPPLAPLPFHTCSITRGEGGCSDPPGVADLPAEVGVVRWELRFQHRLRGPHTALTYCKQNKSPARWVLEAHQ